MLAASKMEVIDGIRNFRKWLAEHGCPFDTQSEKRGEGHGTVTIHRSGRTAELPLVGATHNLGPRSVRQVCEALGLDSSKLPGPEGRLCEADTLGQIRLNDIAG